MVLAALPIFAFQAPWAPDAFELLWVVLTMGICFAIMVVLGRWWSH